MERFFAGVIPVERRRMIELVLVGHGGEAFQKIFEVTVGFGAGYGYDLAGNLTGLQYGNGVTNQYQYDSLNRLTNLTWNLTVSTLAKFSYQLGATGNRTNLTENLNGTSRAYQWQYDNLYRLTNEAIGIS